MPVAAEQIVEIAVNEAVLPQVFKQGVQKKPGIFDIAHLTAGGQQGSERCAVPLKQGVDQFVLGRVVVVEVTGADAQLGRQGCGRDVRLAKAVEHLQRRLQNALRGTPRRFSDHALFLLL